MYPSCSRENSYDTDASNEYLRGHTICALNQVCHVLVLMWDEMPFQFV